MSYTFISPLPDESKDLYILKSSYRNWVFSPNDMSAELEISACGKKEAATGTMYNKIKLTCQIPSLG